MVKFCGLYIYSNNGIKHRFQKDFKSRQKYFGYSYSYFTLFQLHDFTKFKLDLVQC